jgi:hypothetical protein
MCFAIVRGLYDSLPDKWSLADVALVRQNPAVKVQRLSAADGFVVWDLADARRFAGVVRMAPKVLQDGAQLLARQVTYTLASFGLEGVAGASVALNAKPEQRDETLAAFGAEIRPVVDEGRLRLQPGLGVSADDLVLLGVEPDDPALQAAGALAAARVAGPLDWRRAAVVGNDPVSATAMTQLEAAGATLAEGRYDADCDVLFVGGKAGALDHDTASTVKASTIVPLTPVPFTARALAVLSKADKVVVPDFLSTAAPLLAAFDADGDDPAQRIREATIALAEHGPAMWLTAAQNAEAHLATWTPEKPFGRPLA